eukprot:PhM_4_TR8447/c0_g1_i2/m.51378
MRYEVVEHAALAGVLLKTNFLFHVHAVQFCSCTHKREIEDITVVRDDDVRLELAADLEEVFEQLFLVREVRDDGVDWGVPVLRYVLEVLDVVRNDLTVDHQQTAVIAHGRDHEHLVGPRLGELQRRLGRFNVKNKDAWVRGDGVLRTHDRRRAVVHSDLVPDADEDIQINRASHVVLDVVLAHVDDLVHPRRAVLGVRRLLPHLELSVESVALKVAFQCRVDFGFGFDELLDIVERNFEEDLPAAAEMVRLRKVFLFAPFDVDNRRSEVVLDAHLNLTFTALDGDDVEVGGVGQLARERLAIAL